MLEAGNWRLEAGTGVCTPTPGAMRMVVILGAGDWRLEAGEKWIATEAQRHRGGNWSNGDTPIPGVCVRVARKGLTRRVVRKSGKQRTYKEAFLRFGATDEIPKGYATPGVLQKECGSY